MHSILPLLCIALYTATNTLCMDSTSPRLLRNNPNHANAPMEQRRVDSGQTKTLALQEAKERELKWDFAKTAAFMRTSAQDLQVKGAQEEANTRENRAELQQAFVHMFDALETDGTHNGIDIRKLEDLSVILERMNKRSEKAKALTTDEKLAILKATPAEKLFIRGLPYQKQEPQSDIAARLCALPDAISINNENGTITLESPIIDAIIFNRTLTHITKGAPELDSKQAVADQKQNKQEATSFEQDFAALDKALDHKDPTVTLKMHAPGKFEEEVKILERAFELMDGECNIPVQKACGPKAQVALLYYLIYKRHLDVNKVPGVKPLIELAKYARLHSFEQAKAKFILLLHATSERDLNMYKDRALEILHYNQIDQERNNHQLGCTDSLSVGVELIEAAADPAKRNNLSLQEYLMCMEQEGATETEKNR